MITVVTEGERLVWKGEGGTRESPSSPIGYGETMPIPGLDTELLTDEQVGLYVKFDPVETQEFGIA